MSPGAENRIRQLLAELGEVLIAELDRPLADPSTPETLLSVDDAREAMGGIARSTLYELIARGALRTVTVGRRRLVPSSAIADYAAARR